MFYGYRCNGMSKPVGFEQRSIENLKVGDLIFFHCGTFFSKRSHIMIKVGDIVSMMPSIPSIRLYDRDFDKHLIHVEMVIGINARGQAIIGGVTGKEKVARAKVFQDFIDELPPNDVNSYEVMRPYDRNFVQTSANVLKELIERKITYSNFSCLVTMLPCVFKHHTTIHHTKMMCQEIILNVLCEADKRLQTTLGYSSGCGDLDLRAQSTPARTFYKLLQNDNWNYLGNFSIKTSCISEMNPNMRLVRS